MQALEHLRIRKTPFGDTPTPTESRYARADFIAHVRPEGTSRSRYEIFSIEAALDGLSGPAGGRSDWDGGGSPSPRARR